jgi:hypothetical protein
MCILVCSFNDRIFDTVIMFKFESHKEQDEFQMINICEHFFFTGSTAPFGPWPLAFQFHDNFTDGRIPWASDQLVARLLLKHRTTHTHQTSMPCVGFEPTIPAYRASEDSSCLRPLGYCDRHIRTYINKIKNNFILGG